MKLFELAATKPSKQAAKVFESYFGNSIEMDAMSAKQARTMLSKVRSLVKEHRATPAFHSSEKNPAYLKLIMLESALAARVSEESVPTAGMTQQGTQSPQTNGQTQPQAPGVNPANVAMQIAQKKKQLQDEIKDLQQQIQQQQQAMNSPTLGMGESAIHNKLYYQLHESEIQQAQVVLASQDMVDQVQKMLEQVTSIQFKDLPALVDQIKNEVGQPQSQQFNSDANAALGGLVQNLQGAKQQLEVALGVVTGQTPAEIPGAEPAPELGAEPAPELGAEELPPAPEEEPEAEPGEPGGALGRTRR